MSDEEKSVSDKPSSTGSENDAGEGLCSNVNGKASKSTSRELGESCDAVRRLRRRISNRESARRLRKQRSEKLSALVSQQDNLLGLSNGLATQISGLRKRLHTLQTANRSLLLGVESATMMELTESRPTYDEETLNLHQSTCEDASNEFPRNEGVYCQEHQHAGVVFSSNIQGCSSDCDLKQPLGEDLGPYNAASCGLNGRRGRFGPMATRSQTLQHAKVEVVDAIKELTSPCMTTSAGSLSVAHAAKDAAVAAAAAMCAESHTTILNGVPRPDSSRNHSMFHAPCMRAMSPELC